MGAPMVEITKALRLAGELEDQELATRLARGARGNRDGAGRDLTSL